MTKILFVRNAIQAALMVECILPEMKTGKWSGKSQSNLVKDWVDIEVCVAPEGHPIGRTFEAQKTNWNVNDSNWVNPEKNFKKIAKTARSANNGTELPKKSIVFELEDLKKSVFPASSFPIPSEETKILLIEDLSKTA